MAGLVEAWSVYGRLGGVPNETSQTCGFWSCSAWCGGMQCMEQVVNEASQACYFVFAVAALEACSHGGMGFWGTFRCAAHAGLGVSGAWRHGLQGLRPVPAHAFPKV